MRRTVAGIYNRWSEFKTDHTIPEEMVTNLIPKTISVSKTFYLHVLMNSETMSVSK